MTYNLSTPSFPSLLHAYIPASIQPLLLLSYPVPSPSPRFYTSFKPALHTSTTTLYEKGPKDVFFVAFCAVALTLLRECTMRWIFGPFARWWVMNDETSKQRTQGVGMTKREKRRIDHVVTRFEEQGWAFLYPTVFWSLGVLILSRLPSPISPDQLWGTYPYTPIPFLTKFYYLAQLGFWFHQIYVLHMEKRRKDHYQMFGHHVVVIALMSTSYAANFSRVGILIHFLMDFCDILLPVGPPSPRTQPEFSLIADRLKQLAKMMRYLSLTNICDVTAVFFLISWLFTRQIAFFLIIKSVYFDLPAYVPFKWAPEQGRYLTFHTWIGFVVMLGIIQVLCCIWFYMAIRVAYKVVKGEGAEDSRSDDEDEVDLEGEEDEDEDEDKDRKRALETAMTHTETSALPAPSISEHTLTKRR
ncbi:hypothetical protein P7C73_g141, partial [Tremellales sp. Uapishka_1]